MLRNGIGSIGSRIKTFRSKNKLPVFTKQLHLFTPSPPLSAHRAGQFGFGHRVLGISRFGLSIPPLQKRLFVLGKSLSLGLYCHYSPYCIAALLKLHKGTWARWQ